MVVVIDSENNNSWNWFMTKLEDIIPDDEESVIISDKHHSIIKAVGSQHGFCTWHLSKNIKSQFNIRSRSNVESDS